MTHYILENKDNTTSPGDFMEFHRDTLLRFMREHPNHKIQFRVVCEMTRSGKENRQVLDRITAPFSSEQESVFEASDVVEIYDMKGKIERVFEEFKKSGSGWEQEKLVSIDITLSRKMMMMWLEKGQIFSCFGS